MYLYVATDRSHQENNTWFIGFSKHSPDKIKEELNLQLETACVDRLIESSNPREILKRFRENYPDCRLKKDNQNILIATGSHEELARLLTQINRDYEQEHPSLKRSVVKWLTYIS